MGIPDPHGGGRFHYSGVGGSGMSALAQFQAMQGGSASGSDRAFDRGERTEWRGKLERLGIIIHPQDGSGVTRDCAALVVSTAVEDTTLDVRAAHSLGVPILHRSELLAHYVESSKTIAISGTSGKSTVVAMVFEILQAAGRRPSVITGGELRSLEQQGLWGNAWFGGSNLLVVEADESDGSLIRYRPEIGVVINLQRDHKEPHEVLQMFEVFRRQTRGAFVVGQDKRLLSLNGNAIVFGFDSGADIHGTDLSLDGTGSGFKVEGVPFRLPIPGAYNVENALAAIATCQAAGVALEHMVSPLTDFGGVGRRFQSVGMAQGIEVVDDFAHNPNKIRAAIEAAQLRARRVLGIYQPHGYGPTRFHREELVAAFGEILRKQDALWLLEVYYAGGTASRDVSAEDIVGDIQSRGARATFVPSRDALVDQIAKEARTGDLVLVMGARDPSLTDLAQKILNRLSLTEPRTMPTGKVR